MQLQEASFIVPQALEASASTVGSRRRAGSPAVYSPLKYQRLLRGWTLQDVADELYRRCCAEGKPDVGVMADTVGRWERGNARPSPKYRKHLCELYGMNAAQLGLL